MKLKLQILLSALLFPVVFGVFLIDRFILLFLFWMPMQSLRKWFNSPIDVQQSLLRVITVGLIYSVIFLISLFF